MDVMESVRIFINMHKHTKIYSITCKSIVGINQSRLLSIQAPNNHNSKRGTREKEIVHQIYVVKPQMGKHP